MFHSHLSPLARHLWWIVLAKLCVLCALWWVFIRPERVSVDDTRMAGRLAAPPVAVYTKGSAHEH
jgi:hypothetical protein